MKPIERVVAMSRERSGGCFCVSKKNKNEEKKRGARNASIPEVVLGISMLEGQRLSRNRPQLAQPQKDITNARPSTRVFDILEPTKVRNFFQSGIILKQKCLMHVPLYEVILIGYSKKIKKKESDTVTTCGVGRDCTIRSNFPIKNVIGGF